MRRALPSTVTALGLLVLGGCGSPPGKAPAACLAGPGAYLKALEAAPGAVRLANRTPISDCIAEEQSAAEIATVGQSMIAAATRLNVTARERPSTERATGLGYLVGAVSVGDARTGGIHEDLLRRVNAAARFNAGAPFPADLRHAYAKGYAAARRNG